MKSFNTIAICVPELHYMVDTTEKMKQIEKLIANGDYFTINRARQYGKTTMMYSLCRRLKSEYLVLLLSFEGLGDEAFSDDEMLVQISNMIFENTILGLIISKCEQSGLYPNPSKEPFIDNDMAKNIVKRNSTT